MNNSSDEYGDVCVVGVGAATAIGAAAAETAAAVRAGIAMFVDHPYMVSQEGDPFVVAMAPYLDAGCLIEERIAQLALSAAEEALETLRQLSKGAMRVPAIIGLPESRPGCPPELATYLSGRLTDSLPISEARLLPNGHSAGLMAIEAGCKLINGRHAEFCLAGGVDSYIDADALEWIERCEQLHKPSNAWGFVPGEAAGFCLLCSGEARQRHSLKPLARIVGVKTAVEENRIKTETVCVGQGLTQAVRKVLDTMPDAHSGIDSLICDQNGEAYRADEFGFMLARTSESFANPTEFFSPADCWGDVGAASGPLFVTLATVAARKAYAKGPYTLVSTSSEGGERSAAIIRADVETGSR